MQLCLLRALTCKGCSHLADLSHTPAGITFTDRLASSFDFRALFVVNLGVGLELEEQVAAIYDQQEDGGAYLIISQSEQVDRLRGGGATNRETGEQRPFLQLHHSVSNCHVCSLAVCFTITRLPPDQA